MIAANNMYNVAKPDGLTMASIGPSLYLDQVIGKKEVKFDWAQVRLGRLDGEYAVAVLHEHQHTVQNHRRCA